MASPNHRNETETSDNDEKHKCCEPCACEKGPGPNCPNSNKCECDDDKTGQTEPQANSESPNPVNYAHGQIRHSETGLSFGVPGMTHGRLFRNRYFSLAREQNPLQEPLIRSPIGNNWNIQEQAFLTLRDKGGSLSIMAKIGQTVVWFDRPSGASVFTARFAEADTYRLSHNTGTQRYTMTHQTHSGVETWVFQDFSDTNTNAWGSLIL